MLNFQATVSAVTASVMQERFGQTDDAERGRPARPECRRDARAPGLVNPDKVQSFVITQHGQMPDYARMAIWLLSLLLDASPLINFEKPFHMLSHEKRWRHALSWKQSPIALCRDLIRFYETLIVFAWYSEREPEMSGHGDPVPQPRDQISNRRDRVGSGRGAHSLFIG
jgi:hypothetical protein